MCPSPTNSIFAKNPWGAFYHRSSLERSTPDPRYLIFVPPSPLKGGNGYRLISHRVGTPRPAFPLTAASLYLAGIAGRSRRGLFGNYRCRQPRRGNPGPHHVSEPCSLRVAAPVAYFWKTLGQPCGNFNESHRGDPNPERKYWEIHFSSGPSSGSNEATDDDEG